MATMERFCCAVPLFFCFLAIIFFLLVPQIYISLRKNINLGDFAAHALEQNTSLLILGIVVVVVCLAVKTLV